MSKSLKPYREATLTKTHMVWGAIVMAIVIVMAFLMVPIVTLV